MSDLFGGNDYDRGVNTFNPGGRLYQLEYAVQAIKLGSTVLAIQTSQGIVIGAEKRVKQKCLVSSSIKKIVEISRIHIAGVSGLTADGNILLDEGRVEAQNYKFTYDEYIPTESLVRGMCDFAMDFGSEGAPMSRPLGVSMLVAGLDRVGKNLVPKLYHLDPSGTYIEYRAKAIGAGEETAMESLVNNTSTSMSLEEATSTVLDILKSVMEEKVNANNTEIQILERKEKEDGSFEAVQRKIGEEELKTLLSQLEDSN